MANVVLLKRSAVTGKVPTTAQLQLGELAINTHDGKLYLKTNDGATPTAKEEIIESHSCRAGQYHTGRIADQCSCTLKIR